MNKKECNKLVKQAASHFGERVSCEWLSPDGSEWNEWTDAEINTLFLMNLEKGQVRNLQLPQVTVVIQAEPIATFETFQEWENQVISGFGEYGHNGIICIDQNDKILLSDAEFSFAKENDLFPVRVYRMVRH